MLLGVLEKTCMVSARRERERGESEKNMTGKLRFHFFLF